MHDREAAWKKLSLKKKIVVMTLHATLVAIGLMICSTLIMNSLMNDYEKNIAQNSICYDLQEALQDETGKFLAYIRERSTKNRDELEKACERTEKCIEKLPFDYKKIGKERYAITWNICNGYEGYQLHRDSFLLVSVRNEDYVDELYKIFDMQEDLASYALDLVEVTLEQGRDIYNQREFFYHIIPHLVTLLAGGTLVWILLFLHRFARNLVTPMIELAKASRRIAAKEFQIPDVQTEREDEIGELVHAFNKMKTVTGEHIFTIERLREEEAKNFEKEKRLEAARLEVLKSQVNPHFLYNTLNMISCMAKIEEAEVTDKMIFSLSNLFRYNLRTIEQEVYLEQEVEVLDDYIYIQQMRFDNRIEYQKEIYVDSFAVKIPSFTLQPLVENAFIHGLAGKEADGKIRLRVWMEENHLMLSISDNGCGMSGERLMEVRRQLREGEDTTRGIGIGNISRRIQMLYGEGHFEIDSQPDQGTAITITIPQEVVKGELESV